MRTNMFLAHSVTFASILTAMACANSDVGQLADVETQTDQSQAPLAAAGSLSAPTSDVIGPVGLTGYVYHFGTEQLRASPPTASDLAAQVVQTAGTLPSSNFVYQPSGQGFSIQMSGGDAVAIINLLAPRQLARRALTPFRCRPPLSTLSATSIFQPPVPMR